jgi:hypothetical protein
MHHKIDELTETTSDEVIELIQSRVTGLRKRDRTGITLSILLNAFERSPDFSQGMKDDIAAIFAGPDRERNVERSEMAEKAFAALKRIGAEDDAKASESELDSIYELATELSLDMSVAVLRRLREIGHNDHKMNIVPIYGQAIMHLVLMLDSTVEGKLTVGDVADELLAAINRVKVHFAKAA